MAGWLALVNLNIKHKVLILLLRVQELQFADSDTAHGLADLVKQPDTHEVALVFFDGGVLGICDQDPRVVLVNGCAPSGRLVPRRCHVKSVLVELRRELKSHRTIANI